ncbi:hypothetical protein ACJRO7_010357 [Eucalyptus globulus]|uniref:Disease resistance N-terminal domain-containing protein n=1 Tax=Eucalyptus globulus TaxID=34317 RepID=A0ABD3LBX7_EUCGL
MAEAVISIAGRILANLITQALQKAGKLGGVKDQLVLLECNVSMLRVELDHAEEQYYQSPQIKDWVEKLKDAFYDAQDVLEEFNMEATRREQRGDNEIIKKVRKVVSSSNQLAFELKMSRKVRIVRERIEVLGNKKDCYLNKQSMDSQVERERRKGEEMDSFILKKDIIGRDYDEKKVKKFLLDLMWKRTFPFFQ